ncbi:MAG: IS1634 family transposase [Rubrobacter sp.]|jgi:transposase|nr:IS1634 family transposase [Rubrobacter sp.]
METAATTAYATERLDHLGIVAGVCQEIGLAESLDAQAADSRQKVSVGTATVAMVLNGLGFSNRRLYLVPQFFENKPLERLLGVPGIEAADLNDDCLGRTLDWLYAHDVTRLFAGIALRARREFGIEPSRVHVDTTSFCVSGEYEAAAAGGGGEGSEEANATLLAVTYGYSRDRRADLKQWMLALATTHEGDVPLFMRPLDGNSSDARTLVAAVEALKEQLRGEEGTGEEGSSAAASIYVADAGIYGEENMSRLARAGVEWVSRVPETSAAARLAIDPEEPPEWRHSADGQLRWYTRLMDLAQGTERWVVLSSEQRRKRTEKTFWRQAARQQQEWEKVLWHLGNRAFACEADAREALKEATKRMPEWLEVEETTLSSRPRYVKGGRPGKDARPASIERRIKATLRIDRERAEHECERRARYIVGTNVLDPARLSEEELIRTYKGQGGVERGFRFLKDPLFLASSVFVKKPERIVALGFVMVVCLLVYRLAEHRLRKRLGERGQSIPNQAGKPSEKPTMRWVFQFFEGIDVLYVRSAAGIVSRHVLHLRPVHEQVLRLLGPAYQKLYDVPI